MQDAASGDCERFNDYNKIGDAPKKMSRIDASILSKAHTSHSLLWCLRLLMAERLSYLLHLYRH